MGLERLAWRGGSSGGVRAYVSARFLARSYVTYTAVDSLGSTGINWLKRGVPCVCVSGWWLHS